MTPQQIHDMKPTDTLTESIGVADIQVTRGYDGWVVDVRVGGTPLAFGNDRSLCYAATSAAESIKTAEKALLWADNTEHRDLLADVREALVRISEISRQH